MRELESPVHGPQSALTSGFDTATIVAVIVAGPLVALATAILVASLSQSPSANQRPANAEPVRASPATDQPASEPRPAEPPPIADSTPKPAAAATALAAEGASPPSRDDAAPAAESPAVRVKDSRRGPLVEAYGKEAYNALTELKATIESETWEDAARLVTGLDPAQAPGVAPWIDDAALATSLSVAAQLAHEDYPQLRQALGDQFAVLAKLRLAEAVRSGNAAAIELATAQFAGTPAAAEAHQWLGDQALVAGWFSRSIQQYERARSSDPALATEVATRIRLAAAMLGRDSGTPATQGVQFGDVSMSGAEFETLIAEMKGRGSPDEAIVANDYAAAPPGPKAFETQVRSRLESAVGDRQIAAAVEGNVMYVANHFQVAAYDLIGGGRLWQSEQPPGPMQRGQEWGMIRMRPLVHGDRIFVRVLDSPHPLLVCLDKSSGKRLWAAENRDREFVVSDPLFVQGQLVALVVALQPDQQFDLRHCTFDSNTGQKLRDGELVRLRNTWSQRSCCEIVGHDEGLVAVLGGATLALDGAGNVRWIRKHVALPTDEDPGWVQQMFQQPLLKGDRLYVAQPGTRTVDCLAAATGRQYWSAVLPDVVGLVGLAGDKLIVRTAEGVRGLATVDGTTHWRYASRELFSFHLVDRNHVMLAERQPVPNQPQRWHVRLTWLNPADGQAIAHTVLSKLDDPDPRLGPLVPFKDRLFTFFGRGQHEAARDLVELVPSGAATATSP